MRSSSTTHNIGEPRFGGLRNVEEHAAWTQLRRKSRAHCIRSRAIIRGYFSSRRRRGQGELREEWFRHGRELPDLCRAITAAEAARAASPATEQSTLRAQVAAGVLNPEGSAYA